MAGGALHRAVELATQLGTSVAVVHAYEDAPGARHDGDPAVPLLAQLEALVSPLRRRTPSLHVECFVRRGAPWEKLVNVAYDLGAEMIVVGAREEETHAHASFSGRVVTRMAATSNRPVLVVPATGG